MIHFDVWEGASIGFFNSRDRNGGSSFVMGDVHVTMEEVPVAETNDFEDDVPHEDDDMVVIHGTPLVDTVTGGLKKEDKEE